MWAIVVASIGLPSAAWSPPSSPRIAVATAPADARGRPTWSRTRTTSAPPPPAGGVLLPHINSSTSRRGLQSRHRVPMNGACAVIARSNTWTKDPTDKEVDPETGELHEIGGDKRQEWDYRVKVTNSLTLALALHSQHARALVEPLAFVARVRRRSSRGRSLVTSSSRSSAMISSSNTCVSSTAHTQAQYHRVTGPTHLLETTAHPQCLPTLLRPSLVNTSHCAAVRNVCGCRCGRRALWR